MIMRVLQNKIQLVMYSRGLLHQNGRLSASKSNGVDGQRSRNVLKELKNSPTIEAAQTSPGQLSKPTQSAQPS